MRSSCPPVTLGPKRPGGGIFETGLKRRGGDGRVIDIRGGPALGCRRPRNYGDVMAEQGYRVPEVCNDRRHHLPAARLLGPDGPGQPVGQGCQGLGDPTPILLPGPRHAQADQADARHRGEPAAGPQGHEDPQGPDQPAHGTTLVSDGHRCTQVESPEAVVDLLAGGQGVFAIAVDKVWTDLEGTLAKKPGRRRRSARAAGGA